MNKARATPIVEFNEIYEYESEIRENRFTDFREGKGKVKIKHNMGEKDGFDNFAYYDLFGLPPKLKCKRRYKKESIFSYSKNQKDKITTDKINFRAPILTGRLVVLDHSEKTDLQEKLDLSYNLTELSIPSQNIQEKIRNKKILTKEYFYNPSEPDIKLGIEGEFTDERSFEEIWNKENEDYHNISVYGENARIELIINLDIPKNLSPHTGSLSSPPPPPILEYLTIDWPLSNEEVEPLDDRQDENFKFDPKKEKLRWENIFFENGTNQNKRDREFKATVGFEIPNPAILFDISELSGSLSIEQPGILFSGSYSRVFDPTGREKSNKIKLKSKIIDDFFLDLQGIFKQKNFLPLREYHFDGVIPNEQRINDIKETLRNKGIELHPDKENNVKKPPEYEDGELKERSLILEGETKLGAEQALLLVRVEGKKKEMEREITVEGGYKGTTMLETGETNVLIVGYCRNHKKMTNLLNSISSSLKEKFSKVAIVG